MAKIRLEIEQAPVPAGVDPQLYAELKQALINAVESRTAGKQAAKPPTGNVNQVFDLVLAGNELDGWRLEWSYLSTGDYDLNSEVNVSDLTPVGLHFNGTCEDENWLDAMRADGDGNGEVNLADITPIGINYGSKIAGYRVYGSDSPEGPWTVDSESPLGTLPIAPPLTIVHELVTRDYTYYQITPVDGVGTEGSTSFPCMQTGSPATISPGTKIEFDTQTIGPSGGTLLGPDEDGRRLEVSFPADALDEPIEFTLGIDDGIITRNSMILDGRILYLDCPELVDFNVPIEISVPVPKDPNILPVPFRKLSDNSLETLSLSELDTSAGIAKFQLAFSGVNEVLHSTSAKSSAPFPTSGFVLIDMVMDAAATEYSYSFSTDFKPAVDGIKTKPSTESYDVYRLHQIGHCAFAIWYYNNYRQSMGPFSERFPDMEVQQRIAMRASMSFLVKHSSNNGLINSKLSHFEAYQEVKDAIRNSNGPVMVKGFSEGIFNREFVAYAYAGDMITLYDPWKPGVAMQLDLSSQDNYVRLIGTGAFNLYESYENILLDATADPPFGGSDNATITITSHSPGENVQGDTVTLTGYITSGSLLIEEVSVLNTAFDVETIATTIVPESGDFTLTVPVKPDYNPFIFMTSAYVLGDFRISLEFVSNNYEYGEFWLMQQATTPGLIKVIVRDGSTNELIARPRAKLVNSGYGDITGLTRTNEPVLFKDLAPGLYYIYVYCEGYHFAMTNAVLPPGEELEVPVTLVPGPSAATMEIELTYSQLPDNPRKYAYPRCSYYHPITGDYWRVSYQDQGNLDSLPFMLLSGEKDALYKTLSVSKMLQPEPDDISFFKYAISIGDYWSGGLGHGQLKIYLDDMLVFNLYLKEGCEWYDRGVACFYPGTGEIALACYVGFFWELLDPV